MTKKELLDIIADYDDNAVIYIADDATDFDGKCTIVKYCTKIKDNTIINHIILDV